MRIHNLLLLAIVAVLPVLAHPAVAQPPGLKPGGVVFDDETRGLQVRDKGALPGYTLYSPIGADYALLVDLDGEVVHRWEADCSPGSLYLLDSGSLFFLGQREVEGTRFKGPGVGGGVLQEITWDGEKMWEFTLHDDRRLMHHDVERLPNGNVLIIVWEYLPQEQVIALGRDPEHVDERGMWFDAVLELKPTPPEGAEVVWEWHSRDHLIQDHGPDLAAYGSIPEHPGRVDLNADHRDRPPLTLKEKKELEETRKKMLALGYTVEKEKDGGDDGNSRVSPDWLHTNAVAYHAEYDLIVLSTPRMGELWVIDHSTSVAEAKTSSGGRWGHGGNLLWRWGNPRTYGAGNDKDKQLFYQHDPKWIAPERPGELRLLVFNNGSGRSDLPYSSVDELVLPFDPEKGFLREEGEAFGPVKPAWSYFARGEFFSPFISGCQRLPNGNTLICSGVPGRIFEVTLEGEIVWDYGNPHEGKRIDRPGGPPPTALFRATRIGVDHPGLGPMAQ